MALAEPTRRMILEMLAARGELSATDISGKFSVTRPAISQHLRVLREAKLIEMEKQSRKRVYRLSPRAIIELEHWTGRMKKLWSERFDSLDTVLGEEKQK